MNTASAPQRREGDPEKPTAEWALKSEGDERERRMALYQAEMARQREAHVQEREAAKVYQLAFWGDEKGAMPTDFIACALFAGVHAKTAMHLRGEQIANVNGYTVTFTGRRLTQVHADICMGVWQLMRGMSERSTVMIRTRSFLRLIGRPQGKSNRDSFRQLIDDLIATAVRITSPDGKISYSGSVLTKARDAEEGGEPVFSLEVNRELARLFARGFGAIDWEQRKALKAKPLALWFQLYLSRFGTKPAALKDIHAMYGGKDTLRSFRRSVKLALLELHRVGVGCWMLGEDDIIRSVAALPAPESAAKTKKLMGSSVGGPRVSAEARDRFRAMFGRDEADTDRCIGDWHRWLAEKSKTADVPDAAFLGFAKKWVTSN
jgi:hypothetical protein